MATKRLIDANELKRRMVMGMVELIDKWEVVSKLITLQNNYTFFKNEWDAERLYREIAKLEIGICKIPGVELVRCKDCKYYYFKSGIDENRVCGIFYKSYYGEEAETEPDDFCSYGERKDNDSF